MSYCSNTKKQKIQNARKEHEDRWLTFFRLGCPNFSCRCVWGFPLMEWPKGPMCPALNKSLSKHQHHHQIYLSTPLTLYLVLLSSIGKPDGARFDILRPLIPAQIAFEAETRTRYEIYFSSSNNGFRSLVWINMWNNSTNLWIQPVDFCPSEDQLPLQKHH